MTFASENLAQTQKIAGVLAAFLKGGEIILLNGQLGAGKTTFTNALAAQIGVKKQVNSPTFTIIKTYQGKFRLVHVDMYRLAGANEAVDLGLEEYFDDNSVIVIEWNKLENLKGKIINVDIEVKSLSSRIFEIKGL